VFEARSGIKRPSCGFGDVQARVAEPLGALCVGGDGGERHALVHRGEDVHGVNVAVSAARAPARDRRDRRRASPAAVRAAAACVPR
jgi:hypothetical protein